jgi:hypothetical protein
VSTGKEIWVPTSVTSAQVSDHNVKVWDDITFELRKIKRPAGLSAPLPKDDA